ncbi:hypothetical protein [Roseobacter sp. HKCCD7870]|uniref:hypothetical protein n=1 Tax=Roseobacter sp. HKCCD7870 TaxID=3120343 RepID=UPI0030EBF725
MKAKDIQSADDLRAWLKGLPEEQALRVAPLIACRAAMRVLPFWARSKQDDLAALPVFWCSLSNVASHENRATIRKFGRRASQPTAADSSSVALVAYAAASAADAAVASAANVAAASTSLAAIAAVDSAAVTIAVHAAYIADATAVEQGEDLTKLPLLPDGADPHAEVWENATPLFQRHPAWSVFKDLYENALHARPQNWPLLNELAQKGEAFWTGTDTEFLDRIAGVMEGFAISRAIPFDYTFDQIARMMRIVGIDDDTAHLRDPQANRRFLDDAREARDLLQDFVDYTESMGGGRNTVGATRVAAEKLLNELNRVENIDHLRVRILMNRAKYLEMFMGDPQQGDDLTESLIKILADAVTNLRAVFRTHFGPAFAALAPLSQLSWDQLDRDAVLSLFDQKIDEIRGISSEKVPLDPEGQAILADMLRELFEWRARVSQASDDQMREIFDQRFAEATGATGLALLRFWQKRAPQIGKLADGMVKIGNAANALGDIVESVTNLSN